MQTEPERNGKLIVKGKYIRRSRKERTEKLNLKNGIGNIEIKGVRPEDRKTERPKTEDRRQKTEDRTTYNKSFPGLQSSLPSTFPLQQRPRNEIV